MSEAILYIHGKGGSAKETEMLKPFLEGYDLFGIDLADFTPWGTEEQIRNAFGLLHRNYDQVSIVANSIGAFFAMFALQRAAVKKAYFISPILDMEKLIRDMMRWAGVTEQELQQQQTIRTDFGETLYWEYFTFVKEHPIHWGTPTEILYAEHDHMTSRATVDHFVRTHNARLTVMPDGEHWFHTPEQIAFLGEWLKRVGAL